MLVSSVPALSLFLIASDGIYSVVNHSEYHSENILNFFDIGNTNAESFNSKIKGFWANLRGVTDVKFSLFRLEKSFA